MHVTRLGGWRNSFSKMRPTPPITPPLAGKCASWGSIPARSRTTARRTCERPVFLDANVLVSAAWRSDNGLLALWKSADIDLLTSAYAIVEAGRIQGVLVLRPAAYLNLRHRL